jgi:hypothetical protein
MDKIVPNDSARNTEWGLWQNSKGKYMVGQAELSVLMDIRRELQAIRSVLQCHNCIDIPHKLDRIEKNTRKPAKKRRAAK